MDVLFFHYMVFILPVYFSHLDGHVCMWKRRMVAPDPNRFECVDARIARTLPRNSNKGRPCIRVKLIN